MSIVFVKLRNDKGDLYDSYCDYWKLVELSGFATCELDQIDRDGDNVYILSPPNGNAHAAAAVSRRCKLVCWSLERPLSGFASMAPPKYDYVFVSDGHVVDKLHDDPRVRFVPVGGHPKLAGEPSDEKRWDITHQSYVYGRRSAILHDLSIAGLKIGHPCWGKERDEQLAASRVGLCLHQDGLPIIEPLRFTLFSCWQLPIVAEHSKCYWPYRVYSFDELREARDGESNWRLLTEDMTFRKCVERAL